MPPVAGAAGSAAGVSSPPKGGVSNCNVMKMLILGGYMTERTSTLETGEGVFVGALCGKVVTLAKTTDDFACTCSCEVVLHRLLC